MSHVLFSRVKSDISIDVVTVFYVDLMKRDLSLSLFKVG